MTLWDQSQGLVTQRGPFKVKSVDTPTKHGIWKGGGVAGGGTLHAGNGNWFSSMTPQAIKAIPYPLKPSQYASLVGPAQPSTSYKRSGMGRSFGKVEGPVVGMHLFETKEGGSNLGKAPTVTPAPQLDDGHDEDISHVDEYFEAMDQDDNDSAVGDTSVRNNLPGNFPNQQQYVTNQQIVEPLLSVQQDPNLPVEQTQQSIVQNWTNTSRISTAQSTTQTGYVSSAEASTQSTTSPTVYVAEPSNGRTAITADIHNHINSLTDEINKLRNENFTLGTNASHAFTNAMNESDEMRRAAITRMNELENEISRLNAELESSATRFNNQMTVYNPVTDLIRQNEQYAGITSTQPTAPIVEPSHNPAPSSIRKRKHPTKHKGNEKFRKTGEDKAHESNKKKTAHQKRTNIIQGKLRKARALASKSTGGENAAASRKVRKLEEQLEAHMTFYGSSI